MTQTTIVVAGEEERRNKNIRGKAVVGKPSEMSAAEPPNTYGDRVGDPRKTTRTRTRKRSRN